MRGRCSDYLTLVVSERASACKRKREEVGVEGREGEGGGAREIRWPQIESFTRVSRRFFSFGQASPRSRPADKRGSGKGVARRTNRAATLSLSLSLLRSFRVRFLTRRYDRRFRKVVETRCANARQNMFADGGVIERLGGRRALSRSTLLLWSAYYRGVSRRNPAGTTRPRRRDRVSMRRGFAGLTVVESHRDNACLR